MYSSLAFVDVLRGVIDECEKFISKMGHSRIVSVALYWNDDNDYSHLEKKKNNRIASSSVDENHLDDFLIYLRDNGQCDWCALSHMNWTHSAQWMDTVLPLVAAEERNLSLVAWDFSVTDYGYDRNTQMRIVTVGPSPNGNVFLWNIIFHVHHFKKLNSNLINLDSSKVKRSEAICIEQAFAVSIAAHVPLDKVAYLHNDYSPIMSQTVGMAITNENRHFGPLRWIAWRHLVMLVLVLVCSRALILVYK